MTARWYVALWRAPWLLIVGALMCVVCVVVSIGFGPKEARRVWRDVF